MEATQFNFYDINNPHLNYSERVEFTSDDIKVGKPQEHARALLESWRCQGVSWGESDEPRGEYETVWVEDQS